MTRKSRKQRKPSAPAPSAAPEDEILAEGSGPVAAAPQDVGELAAAVDEIERRVRKGGRSRRARAADSIEVVDATADATDAAGEVADATGSPVTDDVAAEAAGAEAAADAIEVVDATSDVEVVDATGEVEVVDATGEVEVVDATGADASDVAADAAGDDASAPTAVGAIEVEDATGVDAIEAAAAEDPTADAMGADAGDPDGAVVESDEDSDLGGDLAAVLPTSAASMDAVQLKHLVEALVFASDKPLTVARLRQLTRVSDTRRLEQALDGLATDYQERGLILQQVSGGYQFRTRTQFSSWVQQLIAGRPVRLSRAQLETLAIIAYRQPITRPEIDDIRGVDSSATLKLLIDRQLIRILGKKEEVGRPMLYGTTKEFLDFFSLGDLRELPTLREYSELTDESRRVMSDRLGVDLDPEDPEGGDPDDGDGNGGTSGGSGGDGGIDPTSSSSDASVGASAADYDQPSELAGDLEMSSAVDASSDLDDTELAGASIDADASPDLAASSATDASTELDASSELPTDRSSDLVAEALGDAPGDIDMSSDLVAEALGDAPGDIDMSSDLAAEIATDMAGASATDGMADDAGDVAAASDPPGDLELSIAPDASSDAGDVEAASDLGADPAPDVDGSSALAVELAGDVALSSDLAADLAPDADASSDLAAGAVNDADSSSDLAAEGAHGADESLDCDSDVAVARDSADLVAAPADEAGAHEAVVSSAAPGHADELAPDAEPAVCADDVDGTPEPIVHVPSSVSMMSAPPSLADHAPSEPMSEPMNDEASELGGSLTSGGSAVTAPPFETMAGARGDVWTAGAPAATVSPDATGWPDGSGPVAEGSGPIGEGAMDSAVPDRLAPVLGALGGPDRDRADGAPADAIAADEGQRAPGDDGRTRPE